MKYENFEESPRLQQLGQQFRDQNFRFEGYLDFALSKAIKMVGIEGDREQIIAQAAAILEVVLQKRVHEKESSDRRRTRGFLGFLRHRRIGQ